MGPESQFDGNSPAWEFLIGTGSRVDLENAPKFWDLMGAASLLISLNPKNSASRGTYRFLVLIQSLFLEGLYVYYPTMAFSVGLMVLLTQETSPTPDAIALDDGVSNAKSGGFITYHDRTYQFLLLWLIFGLRLDSLLRPRLMACKMLQITCRTSNHT